MTTHRIFDLRHFVSSINETFVAAQVAQSTAWRMDTLITSKSRTLLRDIRTHAVNTSTADSYAETAAMLRDIAVADKWFKDTGLPRELIDDICRLAALREDWHDLAAELTAYNLDWQGRPRTYEFSDIEDVFHQAPSTKVGTLIKERVAISSKALAAAYNVDETVLRDRRLAQQRRQAEERAESVLETADLAYWTFRSALNSQLTEDEAKQRDTTTVTQSIALEQGFAFLTPATQTTLITGARDATNRALTFAENDRSMTDVEYARILACVLSTQTELDKVLKLDRFVNV